MLSPKSTSSPTNISMDIKIEKSLISLRSCREREKRKGGKKHNKKRKEKKVTELEYSPEKDKVAFKKVPGHHRSSDFPRKPARSWKESVGGEVRGSPLVWPNLDDTGDMELRGVQSETGIHSTEEQDGEDIGKISNESPDLEARQGNGGGKGN